MNDGWVKLHRKMTDWEWYTDGNTVRVFIHLIFLASHEEHNWMGITIKKGELITSLRNISKDLKIGVQSVRTSINRLKSTQEITQYPNTQYTHISINKYNEYQECNTVTNKRVTQIQHTPNNIQEGKELKNILDKSNMAETASHGNEKVNQIIQTFKKYTGKLPIDRRVRFEAYNLSRRVDGFIKAKSKEPTTENFTKALEWVFRQLSEKDYFEHIEKLEPIRLRAISLFDQALEPKEKYETK